MINVPITWLTACRTTLLAAAFPSLKAPLWRAFALTTTTLGSPELGFMLLPAWLVTTFTTLAVLEPDVKVIFCDIPDDDLGKSFPLGTVLVMIFTPIWKITRHEFQSNFKRKNCCLTFHIPPPSCLTCTPDFPGRFLRVPCCAAPTGITMLCCLDFPLAGIVTVLGRADCFDEDVTAEEIDELATTFAKIFTTKINNNLLN